MPDTQPRLFASGTAKALAVVATVCALTAGGAFGVIARGPQGTKVVLEPIHKVARDSWVSGGVDAASGEESTVAEQYAGYRPGENVPDGRKEQVSATLAGDTVSGDAAGVYGGSRDTQVCDKVALIGYFADAANAHRAALWAEVLSMPPQQIANYLEGLTGARLRWDTRVTDSGVRGTTVVRWQALLQAGTAVLVDNAGVPRVKCNSGSPLLAPEGLHDGDQDDLALDDVADNPHDAWPNLDPADAVSIQPGRDPLQTLTLVDVDSDDMLQRDVGSDGASSRDVGSGDVQFNLRWTSRADLDIHVVDPEGNSYGYEEGYYKGEESPNGGKQDVDSNIGCEDERDDSGFAKENVFWPPGDAPSGTYQVLVQGYQVDDCSPSQPGTFILTATVAGEVQAFTGSVGQGDRSETWEFTKPE